METEFHHFSEQQWRADMVAVLFGDWREYIAKKRREQRQAQMTGRSRPVDSDGLNDGTGCE